MHSFPATSDLQFLVGLEIGQIALDPFSVQFRFVGGGQISVWGRFEHVDERGQKHEYDCQSWASYPIFLHQLLTHRIERVEAAPFRLSLLFETGAIVRLLTETGPYECGQIFPPLAPGTPIVF